MSRFIFALVLSFSTLWSVSTKTFYNGWNLVGSPSVVDLNQTFGDFSDISIVWGYNNLNKDWFGWSSSEAKRQALISGGYSFVEQIPATDGFWVLNNGDEKNITLLGTSLEKLLVGNSFFVACDGEIKTAIFDTDMLWKWSDKTEYPEYKITENSFIFFDSHDGEWNEFSFQEETNEYLQFINGARNEPFYFFYDEQTAKDFPIHYCGDDESQEITDTNLLKCINEELEQSEDYQPTDSDLETITKLECKDAVSLDGISKLKNLENIFVPEVSLENSSIISSLNIKMLIVKELNDISSLSVFSNIEFFGKIIEDEADFNLTVSEASKITTLKGFGFFTEYSGSLLALKSWTNLEMLVIQNNPSRDLVSLASAVAEMPNITNLNLGFNNLTDISALSNLTQLKELRLHENDNLEDISALNNLTNLETLSLWWTGVSDISALSSLTNLKILELASSKTISDLSPLYNLTNLETLEINGISDIQKTELQNALPNTNIEF
jgi:hypothetical protein